MAKLQDEVNTANQVSTNRNDQGLGERFFFRLIPKFRAVANVIFFLSAIPFWTRATDLKEWGGGEGGCSKSSEERAWSVGKNENNFEGLR